MPRTRSIPLGLALLALTFSLPALAAEPSPWLEIHSTHFTVITDAGDKKGREVALRFEQMRAVFATLLSKERLNQPIPLTILAFKNDQSYYQAAPLHDGRPINVPGFFLPGEDQDFIVLNLSEEESWRAVAHDFAHMLLNDNYPPAQGWFDEGLAEYFSSIRVDNRQVEIGGDPELRPAVAQDLLGNQHETNPKSLTELLNAQAWLSIPDLFTMKHDASSNAEGTRHTLYYAESWIVMHYLLHQQKLAETGMYFDLVLNQRMPVEEAIQKAYGMTSAQLEQAVKDYFHSQAALFTALDSGRPSPAQPASTANLDQAYRFPTPVGPDDSAITQKPLPEADERALYAEVQIRIPERREVGLKALQTLATTPTPADIKSDAKAQRAEKRNEDEAQLPSNALGNALAHRILAWDHMQRGEFPEAITELGDAAALNQGDMWIRYYLCALKYRMAQANHTDIQGLPNMMLDLRSVLDWYPELAAAYDLLGLARNEGGSTPAAMQAERAAMMLSPRNEMYVYHLAQIYIAGKKWDAADALLDRLQIKQRSEDGHARPRPADPRGIGAQVRHLRRRPDANNAGAAKIAVRCSRRRRRQACRRRARTEQRNGRQAPHKILEGTPRRCGLLESSLRHPDGRRRKLRTETARRRLQVFASDWRRRLFLRVAKSPGHGELQARRRDGWRCRLAGSALKDLFEESLTQKCSCRNVSS